MQFETHFRPARSPDVAARNDAERPPDGPGQRRVRSCVVPGLALGGLLGSAVAVFLPWHADGSGPAGSPSGITLLAILAALGTAPAIDLVSGRLRATGLVALPALGLLAGSAAVAIAVGASGTSLSAQLGTLPAGSGPVVLLVAQLVTTVAGVLATVAFVRDVGGESRPPRSPRRGQILAGTTMVVIVLIGVTGAVLVATPGPAGVHAVGDPATFLGGPGVLSGDLPTAAPVVVTSDGTGPASPCPAPASATLPETADAVLIARSVSLHVAVCRGVSGRLYYFGANPRSRATVTLPAERTATTWTADDGSLRYVLTEARVTVRRGDISLADEPSTSGW